MVNLALQIWRSKKPIILSLSNLYIFSADPSRGCCFLIGYDCHFNKMEFAPVNETTKGLSP